ncbi:MAG TPA: PQQ-dependent sugar dehydrogenase [Solirubrobacterales bacterium]|nr:PQQ-dependent sugar dehydrogenase [Solirubrobacterales bacterium]
MLALRTLGALLVCLLVPASAQAAHLEPIGNFERPTYVTSDPGNPDRLFVVERAGRIKKVEGGVVTTFADLRGAVGCGTTLCITGVDERGLLSIALAPDFDSSGRFYVDYANGETGTIHVAELVAVAGSALAGVPHDVLSIPHEKGNHNGGQLQFGPEGNLFISTGDGGGSNDELHNAQNTTTSALGKILRVSPKPSGGYSVPAGSPFPAATQPANAIWSYGLRNPYRFSFDRLTGAIVIGDVGQGAREEVDYAPAPGLGGGANYGWNCREGLIAGPGSDEGCPGSPGAFVDPIFDYTHAGGACAITGGYVVRDPTLAGELLGRYLYGDYCNGKLRSFVPGLPMATGDRSEGIEVKNLVSFGQDSCGRIYTVSELGAVARVVTDAVALGPSPSTACVSTSPPAPPTRLTHSYAGIKALHRAVKRGERALVTAWVSPCTGRKGEPVKLFRGRSHIATRHLDRACTARFRPKIGRRWSFHTTIAADPTYEAASSRRLGIKPMRARARHRRAS